MAVNNKKKSNTEPAGAVRKSASAGKNGTSGRSAAAKSGGSASGKSTGRGKSAVKASGTGRGKSTAKSSGNNKSSKKTETAAARRTEEEYGQERTNPVIVREAVLWLILAVCILFFISYIGLGGYLGGIISDVSFGMFGIAAYAFPFLAFIAAAFLISNRGSHVAAVKVLSAVGLYLCICSFADLFVYEKGFTDVASMYDAGAASKTGGGVAGGLICSVLRPALGDLGAVVVLFILSIVFLLLITQRSLVRSVKKQSSKVYRSARESSARRREAHQAELARREEQRAAQPDLAAGIIQSAGQLEMSEKEPQRAGQPEQNFPEASAGWKTDSKKARGRENSARRELEVPVMFPVHSRSERLHQKVSGVTMDTRIAGEPGGVGAEIHEIMPKRRGAEEAEDVETSFIDLERMSRPKEAQSDSGLEVYQEDIPLHIEGLESPAEEKTAGAGEDDFPKSTMPGKYPKTASGEKREYSQSASGEPAKYPGTASGESEEYLQTIPGETEEYLRAASEKPEGYPQTAAEMEEEYSGSVCGMKKQTPAQEVAGAETPGPEKAGSKEGAGDKTSARNPRSSQKEIQEGIASVEAEAALAAESVCPEYVYPPLKLLKKGKGKSGSGQAQEVRKTAAKLQQTLESFGVRATVTNVSCGPAVTRYELLPEQGVKVSRIVGLSDDIKLNLAAADIRIEAPIPGKAAVGIEVPNSENSAVALRDLLESDEFQNHPSKLAFATGKDIAGKVVVSDIAKMPHVLIAGATGSGKSVCINTLIMSILYKASPDEVKLIMVDPKVVELNVYNGIPHLLIPVVTDPKKAAGALNWAVAEMMSRYDKFAEVGVRDLKGYNKKIEALDDVQDENKPQKLPQIVIIVDELADLMMVAPGEVEDAICRLAQLARACGIHLVIATQRPSVNVITGLIKANMPSRIAFSVTSSVDSRTILDMGGAEKLLGKGDMLFYPQGYQKPARVQGAFVSDEEVADVVDFLKNKNTDAAYSADIEEQIAKVQSAVAASKGEGDVDALFADAGKFIIEKDKASIGMLQRVFKIGFNRAARIMDQLSDAGVVGPEEGTKPRKILMSSEQFENYLEEN